MEGPSLQALCGAAALKLAVAVLAGALVLTRCSQSVVGNLPLALAGVLTVRWLLLRSDERWREHAGGWRRRRNTAQQACNPAQQDIEQKVAPAPGPAPGDKAGMPAACEEWKQMVRRLLNAAFGRLAVRARRVDPRVVLNDVCELVMEQIELYRDTRESILATPGGGAHAFSDMSPAARERALRREMAADKNLHPALEEPKGHYCFLRAVSEGVVGLLLDPADFQRKPTRVVVRELFASCVLRPLLTFFTPYVRRRSPLHYAHKAIYSLLQDAAPPRGAAGAAGAGPGGGEEPPEELSAHLARERASLMRQQWDFAQRLAQSVREEQSARERQGAPCEAQSLQARTRDRLLQHTRSRSVDTLTGESGGAKPWALPPSVAAARQQAGAQAGAQHAGGAAAADAAAYVSTEPGGADAAANGESTAARPSPDLSLHMGAPPSAGAAQPSGWAAAAAPWVRGILPRRATAPAPRAAEEDGEREPLLSQPGQGPRQESDREASAPAHEGEGMPEQPADGAAGGAAPFGDAHLLAPVAQEAARLASHAQASTSAAVSGFQGTPQVDVVAADLNTSRSKAFVVFKIRVADAVGQWTVSRRYRQFETLHRQLRIHPAYRLRLPPKRIFHHSHDVEFVMSRRNGLDAYLKALVAHPELRGCSDVHEFLRAGSQVYAEEHEPPGGLLRLAAAVTTGARDGITTLKAAASQGLGGVLQPQAGQAQQQQQERQPQQQAQIRGEVAATLRQRSSSTPNNLGRLATAPPAPPRPPREENGSWGEFAGAVKQSGASPPTSRLASAASLPGRQSSLGGLFGKGRRMGLRRSNGEASDPAGSRGAVQGPSAATPSVGSSPAQQQDAGWERGEGADEGAVAGRSACSSVGMGGSPAGSGAAGRGMERSPSKQRFLGHFRKQKQQQQEHNGASSNSASGKQAKQAKQRRAASSPPRRSPSRRIASSGFASDGGAMTRRSSHWQQKAAPGGAPRQQGAPRVASYHVLASRGSDEDEAAAAASWASPWGDDLLGAGWPTEGGGDADAAGAVPPAPWSSPFAFGGGAPCASGEEQGRWPASHPLPPSLECVESAGVSAPLYDMVDCLFQLQTRGFFRRQVLSVARQALSLMAGDAIDDFVLARLRLLRQEHTIGRAISLLQVSLWPGGVWHSRTPAAAAAAAEVEARRRQQEQAGSGSADGTAASDSQAQPAAAPGQEVMQAEAFLDPGPAPLDEEEIREAVAELLLRRAPGALVRLLGKAAYTRCACGGTWAGG
eukprot:scaffold1.g5446.t1